MPRDGRPSRGFTLVELVVVIALLGVIAAGISVFYVPAVQGYIGVRSRADLAAQADHALRRMVRDVQAAVPNSVRTPDTQCFELVPAVAGGRFRRGPDTINDASPGCAPAADCAAPLDVTQATTVFDVLSPLSFTPAVGDWVVVDNQNPGDVYAGSNRAAVQAVTTPDPRFGRTRLTVASTQFPAGYDGARFLVVPNAQRAVFYVCSGADGTLDAQGDGKGTLYRATNYGFSAAYPLSCPPTAGADVLATRVKSCRFVYDPNAGATQQSGFVSMQLEMARNGEVASLLTGAHVRNVP
jgi:MSHA biogenesis protein MshO